MSHQDDAPLRLDQFLKMQRIVDTGGQAKVLIQQGGVRVNGQVEVRRRRQLRSGDRIEVGEECWQLEEIDEPTESSEPPHEG